MCVFKIETMDIVVYILIGVLVVAMLAIFYYYDKADHYEYWLNKYRQWNKEYLTDNTKKHLLIKAQKEYIELLCREMNSMYGIAMAQGWQSKPHDIDKGLELRNTIKELE